MKDSQELTKLILLHDEEVNLSSISEETLSHIYVNFALLITVMDFIKEQFWLNNKSEDSRSYESFLEELFLTHLRSLSFLEKYIIERKSEGIKAISKKAKRVEKEITNEVMRRSSTERKSILVRSLKLMDTHFQDEESLQVGRLQSLGHLGLNLYRTFDRIDDLFSFNYSLDQEMIIDASEKERLYEGAGVGVQSGYSTILLALHRIKPKKGAKIIDLGSGYGRVGLVCSLLRSDIDFIGYEFVPHRVDISIKACKDLSLEKSLRFFVQDLSDPSFKIPFADIYYLYDPFTKETYDYVLEQIIEYSRGNQVTVVTKGNAKGWLDKLSVDNDWCLPEYIDEGNIGIYRSK